jgi:hypothetical protein
MNADPEIFEKAAEILEQRGWCQNSMENAAGALCYSGALRVAAMGSLTAKPWNDTLNQVSLRQWYEFNRAYCWAENVLNDSIPEWNDVPGRTMEEVIDHMKMMAKDLRNKAVPDVS